MYKSINLLVGKSTSDGYLASSFVVSLIGKEPEAQVAHVKLDENGKVMAHDPLTDEKTEVLDNTIVEFQYDLNEANPLFKWKPIRVRHDKTEQYMRTGHIGYAANNDKTAMGVWESMTNPISENTIMTGLEIPKLTDYYKQETSQERAESGMIGVRDFHNKFVKKILLDGTFTESSNDKILLDLSCGRAGDIHRWIKGKYKKILGIDISKENIYNSVDGAKIRKQKYLKVI